MQPYLFPYLGYYQLVSAVDIFVIYDDVQYIKRGWINRNYILLEGHKHLVTLEVKGISRHKKIAELERGGNTRKIGKIIYHAYRKAPFFNEVFPVIERIIRHEETNLSKYVANSIQVIAGYLGIVTRMLHSHAIESDSALKGQDKILQLCQIVGGTHYINPIGGIALYDRNIFERLGIKLNFIKTREIQYEQFNTTFVPNLSIIDVMMFNPKEEVKRLLEEYELV